MNMSFLFLYVSSLLLYCCFSIFYEIIHFVPFVGFHVAQIYFFLDIFTDFRLSWFFLDVCLIIFLTVSSSSLVFIISLENSTIWPTTKFSVTYFLMLLNYFVNYSILFTTCWNGSSFLILIIFFTDSASLFSMTFSCWAVPPDLIS